MEMAVKGDNSSIIHLPYDCLHLICKKLDSKIDRESFGLTCHRLLRIQSWSRKSLEFGCSLARLNLSSSETSIDIDSFVLDKLLNRFSQLESLSLSGCTKLLDSDLTPLQKHGSKLRSLYLDCCFKLTDAGLSSIALGCPGLTFISLYRCNISDDGLETVAGSCLSLKNVNLMWCSLVTDYGISALTNNSHQLRAVKISHCEKIKGVGFADCPETLACVEAESCKLGPEGIMGILSGRGLEYLNVSSIAWCIKGNGLGAIGDGLATNLKILNFRLCRMVNDEAIMRISRGCPLLREWNLSLCTEIGFLGWESIGAYCRNLERLHVNGCRGLCDRGLLALRNGCERLSVLSVTRCTRVSSSAIELFKNVRSYVEVRHEEVLCVIPDWFFER